MVYATAQRDATLGSETPTGWIGRIIKPGLSRYCRKSIILLRVQQPLCTESRSACLPVGERLRNFHVQSHLLVTKRCPVGRDEAREAREPRNDRARETEMGNRKGETVREVNSHPSGCTRHMRDISGI